MVEKKKPANADTKKPSIREIANSYIAVASGAIEQIPAEKADQVWQNDLMGTFGDPEKAKAALASELKKKGGLIYKDKLVTDGDFEVYAELLLSNPSSPNLQLQMLDFGLDDAYNPVIAKDGKKVKYDSKKALEISRSRTESGAKALSGKLKGDFKLGEDEAKALEAHLQATYLDVYSKSGDELSKLEGSPMQHYFNSKKLEMVAGANVAKTAYQLMEPYATKGYMNVQEAGKAAATPVKKAVKGK